MDLGNFLAVLCAPDEKRNEIIEWIITSQEDEIERLQQKVQLLEKQLAQQSPAKVESIKNERSHL